MGGEVKYEISQNAYIKIVLHALKHKSRSVNSVLIGRSKENDVVEIVDSVPLFHNHLGLLTPLEISLIMIEEYYGGEGAGIVGYAHGNERFDDDELCNVAKNIGDHIFRYFPHAPVLLFDNKKLEALPKRKDRSPVLQDASNELQVNCKDLNFFLFQLYIRDASKHWKLAGSDGGSKLILKEPAANAVLLDFISSNKWQDIVDFDDHLDDITKDWLNPDLFK